MPERNSADDLVIDEALRAWDSAVEAGRPPELEAFLAEWPEEQREELRIHLDIHLLLAEVGRPARPARLGNLDVGEQIGRGGMGEVHRAVDRELRREVAVKLVLLDPNHADRIERFLREARAMARVHHDNVVEIYGFGRHEGWIYLEMELLEGSLAGQLDRDEPIDVPTVQRWMADAARGVSACHQVGILHRDLKLENLLIDAEGTVKVADFGIAAVDDLTRLTRTGLAFGTPAYAAPEQLAGDPTDVRTDVFGLGACLFTLLARRTLDPATRADPASALPPGVPRGLVELVQRSLSEDPSRRPVDPDAFAEALYAGGAPRVPWAAVAGAVGAVLASLVLWMAMPGANEPAVSAALPGGYVVFWYQRARSEDHPPDPDAEVEERLIPSQRWERELAILAWSRDPASAVERAFDHGGSSYRVRAEGGEDGVAVELFEGGERIASETLGPDRLMGSADGWGIFREITDEDGDGFKDVALVRVRDEVAQVVILKWEPEVWGVDRAGRYTPSGADLRSDPVRDPATGAVISALHTASGVRREVRRDGALHVGDWSTALEPVGPRVPDDRIRVAVGTHLRAPVELGEPRWRVLGDGPTPESWTWRPGALVSVDGRPDWIGLDALPLEPELAERAAGQPGPAVVSVEGDPAVCAALSGGIRCVELGSGETVAAAPLMGDETLPFGLTGTRSGAVGHTSRGRLIRFDGELQVLADDLAPPSGPPVDLGSAVLAVTGPELVAVDDGGVHRLAPWTDRAPWIGRAAWTRAVDAAGRPSTLLVVPAGTLKYRGLQLIAVDESGIRMLPWRFSPGAAVQRISDLEWVDGRLRVLFVDTEGALYDIPIDGIPEREAPAPR